MKKVELSQRTLERIEEIRTANKGKDKILSQVDDNSVALAFKSMCEISKTYNVSPLEWYLALIKFTRYCNEIQEEIETTWDGLGCA